MLIMDSDNYLCSCYYVLPGVLTSNIIVMLYLLLSISLTLYILLLKTETELHIQHAHIYLNIIELFIMYIYSAVMYKAIQQHRQHSLTPFWYFAVVVNSYIPGTTNKLW